MAVLSHEGTHPIMYGALPLPFGAGLRTGYLARPDAAGTFPVVLVLPTLDGLTGLEKDLCRMFARSGLVAIAVDFYRQGGEEMPPVDPRGWLLEYQEEYEAEMEARRANPDAATP